MGNFVDSINNRLFLQYARIGKCLSSERRLEILNVLSNGPRSVESITQATNMNVANVSRHLQVLLDANLVKFHKEGNYVIYELANQSVADFLLSLWKVCEQQLSDIDQIQQDLFHHYKDVQSISKNDVVKRMKEGTILVIDVRSEEEYATGHIEGAISVPIDKLDEYLKQLPKSTELAAYCRGPYCAYASQAVEKMLRTGFSAYRIEEDVHRWRVS